MPNPFNTPEPVSIAGFPLYKVGCLKKKEVEALGLDPTAEMNRLLEIYELAFEIAQKEGIGEDEALQMVLGFGGNGETNTKLLKYVPKIRTISEQVRTNAFKAEVLLHSRLSPEWVSRNHKYLTDAFCFEFPDRLLELLAAQKTMPLEATKLLIDELPQDIIDELAQFIDKEASRWQVAEDAEKKPPSEEDLQSLEKEPIKSPSTGRKSGSKSKQAESATHALPASTLVIAQ